MEFTNPEAKMKLKVGETKGTDPVDNAIKIMLAFDKSCSEIKAEGRDKNDE